MAWTKEYKAEYAKKYNEEHREQIKANRRYWYEHNKDRIRRTNKEWLEANKDKAREYQRKYYQSHKNDPDFKEKQKMSVKKWISNNREQFNEYQREYRKRKALEELGGARMKETELKQIEEMAKVIKGTEQLAMDMVGALPSPRMYATDLYNKGYRKQNEWISVDERLPESGAHCLVSCKVKRIDGTHGQYVCVGYYAEKFKHLAYGVDDDCVSEYNEENDEFYIAEGWYEVIKNWDDYGFVAIDDFVTHWMPLPEPPKMKGEA